MPLKGSNPAPLAMATGSGKMLCSAASLSDIAPTLAEIQANFVRRRARVTPATAMIMRTLVFGEVRA